MIKILIYVFIIMIILTIFKSLVRIKNSYLYLKRYANYDCRKSKISKKITVIIPVYNEKNNISKSINYFKKLSNICNVIYVTTEKEKTNDTYKKIIRCIDKYKTNNIMVVNCPNIYGTMATQLNFACKELKDDDIIAIYNIDSFPDKRTFYYVSNRIGDDCVFQQVSFFDDDRKGILGSAQHWQNRWSLIYEIGKYLSTSKIEFKYTIGHGLFLKKSILEKYGYWNDSEINEDNEFGYRLIINNVRIKPIPFLEQAGFAKTKSIYIKQQSTWVNGPLYAFSYYRNNKKNLKNFLITLLNFKAFLSWWLFPTISLIFLILSLLIAFKIFIFMLALLVVYVSIFNYFAWIILRKTKCIKNSQYNTNIFNDLIFFLVHSFGAYITIYKIIIGKNTISNKYNTEK